MAGTGRDIRLDFFRGIALLFIFLDHIPDNNVNWLTIRNFGFSDASEIFVFISGYSAALAYGRYLERPGLVYTAARILKRCWQIYIAQLLLFMAFTAQVAYTASHFSNPMFSEEMNIVNFLNEPHITVLQALLLRFRPANMDILPLYIVLLVIFPLILWALSKRPWLVIGLSALLYLAAGLGHWNLDAWPDGKWLFNPFTWQFLFVIGAALGVSPGRGQWMDRYRRWLVPPAAVYLLMALFIALAWRFPVLEPWIPDVVEAVIYPIDKTNLDILRLLHFMALAYLVKVTVSPQSKLLTWRLLRPLALCGQHSLEVFCLGIFLSFFAHLWLVEVNDSLLSQIAVSVVGFGIMTGFAFYLRWFRNLERGGRMASGASS